MGALDLFANASLTFPVVTGYANDGLNQVPVSSTKTVRALLRPRDKNIQITLTERTGVNVNETDYKGHLTENKPEGLVTPCECSVIFDDGQSYKLMLHLPPPSPFYNESDILGTPVLLTN